MDYPCPALRETRHQKVDDDGKKCVILSLNGSASILQVAAAAEFFRKALAEKDYSRLIIDLSATEDVDAAFLQLLVSTGKTQMTGSEIFLSEVPEDHSLKKAARLAGMSLQPDGTWFGLRYPAPGRAKE